MLKKAKSPRSENHAQPFSAVISAKSRQRSDATVGQHLIADLTRVTVPMLCDEQTLLSIFREALQAAGCTILSHVSHRFPGEQAGVTALFLLSESHAAFHTYPEHGYLALDLFVCGNVDPCDVLRHIQSHFPSSHATVRILSRRLQTLRDTT